MKRLLKPAEVGVRLGVSRSTARLMMLDGTIPAIRLRSGKRKHTLRVSEESLDRWLAAQERQNKRTASTLGELSE